MRRISVVLPVYNERESIGPCLRGLASALAGTDHEILVCYDTDEDTTLPAIAAMEDRPASVRLVKNTLGRGALPAIRSGFAAAEGDVVVTTMADLSDPPNRIPRMAEKIRAGAAVVSGSRYMPGGSQRGGPWLKRTLSRIAGVSLRRITGIGTHDATSNFRAYAKDFLDGVAVESRSGFEIALELTVKAHLAGRRVDEVPSTWVERTSGKSNFRLWKWLPSYLRWYLRAALEPALVLAAWAAMSLAALLFVARYGSPIPRLDDLEMATHYAGDRSPTLAWLWSQHNEHRIPLPRVVFLALVETTRDIRAGMAFQVALLAALALASILAARRIRGRTRFVDAFFPLLFLHTGNPANLLMGFQLAIALPVAIAFAVPLILATGSPRPGLPRMLLVGLCALLLPLCGGAGLASAAAIAAWLAAAGLIARRAGRLSALLGALSLATIASYFIGFWSPNAAARSPGIARTLSVALESASLAFGEAGRVLWPASAVAVVIAVASALLLLLVVARREPDERLRASGLAASLAGTILLALSIGWGRGAGSDAGFASRYVLLTAPLLGTTFLVWLRYGGRASFPAQVALFASIAAVLPSNVVAGRRAAEAQAAISSRIDAAARSGASIAEIVDALGGELYPNRAGASARLEMLHAAGFAPFRGRRYEENAPPPDPALAALGTLPERFAGPTPPVFRRIEGSRVLIARTDFEIVYRREPGTRRMSGLFGLPPDRLRPPAPHGLRITIEWTAGTGPPRNLFERRLDGSDLGSHAFSVELPGHEPGSIALKAARDGANADDFWVYVGEIRFD